LENEKTLKKTLKVTKMKKNVKKRFFTSTANAWSAKFRAAGRQTRALTTAVDLAGAGGRV